jgi:hypothetical protein
MVCRKQQHERLRRCHCTYRQRIASIGPSLRHALQLRAGVQEVFAIIEDQQQSPLAQRVQECNGTSRATMASAGWPYAVLCQARGDNVRAVRLLAAAGPPVVAEFVYLFRSDCHWRTTPVRCMGALLTT